MRSRVLPTTTVILALLMLTTIFAIRTHASGYHLSIDSGRLSLQGKNIPLTSILDQIRKQSGIEVQSFAELEEKIDADIYRIPVADGLALLMKNYNYSIGFEENPHGPASIRTLFILSKTGSSRTSVAWRNDTSINDQQSGLSRSEKDVKQHQHLIPAHLKGIPEENDPMQSLTAIDPLTRLELEGAENRLHQILPGM